MALMIGCIWHGLDALQGTRAKPGNHLVINKTEVHDMLYFNSSLAQCPNNENRVSRASVFHKPTLLYCIVLIFIHRPKCYLYYNSP